MENFEGFEGNGEDGAPKETAINLVGFLLIKEKKVKKHVSKLVVV